MASSSPKQRERHILPKTLPRVTGPNKAALKLLVLVSRLLVEYNLRRNLIQSVYSGNLYLPRNWKRSVALCRVVYEELGAWCPSYEGTSCYITLVLWSAVQTTSKSARRLKINLFQLRIDKQKARYDFVKMSLCWKSVSSWSDVE